MKTELLFRYSIKGLQIENTKKRLNVEKLDHPMARICYLFVLMNNVYLFYIRDIVVSIET
ncbi:hypothetical protein DHCNIT_0007810 [Dehalococcoides mccartyi]|nr:hypothetical protein DHCNIT_0007810 [Dehalococcoides mccartyi]